MRKICLWSIPGVLFAAVLVGAQDRPAQKPNAQQPGQTQPRNDAQQREGAQPREGAPSRAQGAAGQNQGDHQLASWLASDNEGEIELAKFAMEQSENDDVKEFAQQAIDDHTKFLNELRKFTQASPLAASSQPGRQPATVQTQPQTQPTQPGGQQAQRTQPQQQPGAQTQRPGAQPQTQPGTQPQTFGFRPGAAGGMVDLLRIKQEIDKQCLASIKEELSKKEGADFDKCFLGHQVMAHMHMLDTLQVMKDHASSELQAVIEEGEKTTEEHLDHAKEILKQSEGSRNN